LVKLFPKPRHAEVEASLRAVGEALRLWLVSQLIAMTCVGVLASLALWWLGLPSPFALGLIAGLADFVPLIGPFIGALPAVVIAVTNGVETALWTMLAFVVIQQLENNVIFPLVAKRVVAVPPALALFAILAAGVLFGPLGLVFGFPLAVTAYVLVTKLYVRDTLGLAAEVPGEAPPPDPP
jgi:predicted PurR-regulated permease PerM